MADSLKFPVGPNAGPGIFGTQGFSGYGAVSRRSGRDGTALALKYGRSYIHAHSPPVKRRLGQSFQDRTRKGRRSRRFCTISTGINLPLHSLAAHSEQKVRQAQMRPAQATDAADEIAAVRPAMVRARLWLPATLSHHNGKTMTTAAGTAPDGLRGEARGREPARRNRWTAAADHQRKAKEPPGAAAGLESQPLWHHAPNRCRCGPVHRQPRRNR